MAVAVPVLNLNEPPGPTSPAGSVTLGYKRPDSPADPSAGAAVFIRGRDVREIGARFAAGLGAFALFLAVRGSISDPAGSWPAIAVIVLLCLLTTAISVWLLWPGYLYGSALLLNAGVTLWYIRDGDWLGPQSLLGLIEANLIALAWPALAWLLLELQVFQKRSGVPIRRGLPIHHLAAVVSSVLVVVLVPAVLINQSNGSLSPTLPWLDWITLGSVAALLVGCLWDRRASYALLALYVLGLAAGGLGVHRLNRPLEETLSIGLLAVAVYVVVTDLFWRHQVRLNAFGQRFGVPPEQNARGLGRLLSRANCGLAGLLAASAVWAEFVFPAHSTRFTISAATILPAALALLFPRRDAPRSAVRFMLIAGLVGFVSLVCAHFDPAVAGTPIHRAAAATVILLLLSIVISLRIPLRVGDDGIRRSLIRPLVGPMMIIALIGVGVTIGLEASAFADFGQTPTHPIGIAAMFVTLLAACGTSVRLALRPATDPFDLPPRRRTIYVYAAEGLLVAALAHLRMTMPQLFGGPLQQYWPLIVMAIAFADVGLGELLRRRGSRTLGDPLAFTGVLLPILPVLAWWLARSAVDYSTLLISVGVLYGLVSVVRRSFAFMLIAAVAGNVALWFFLDRYESLAFFAHPQLWVVPAAMSFLASAELNRNRLGASQLRAIRYACLSAVYVSSTGDVLLAGATRAPWLPLVLGALAVAGVFAGMLLRVRVFLFMGTGFLAVAVLAMIRNAAINLQWTWIWYVAGIVAGILILLVFAIFEKKRGQILELLESLKRWD